MNEEFGGITVMMTKEQEEARQLVSKLFDVARPGAVFSEPVEVGEHTVITASEVHIGMGYGYGSGFGGDLVEGEDVDSGLALDGGGGFGSGGGGASGGRPVAAILVGPDGVRVEPIVDVTKLGLAFFTTLGAMFLMLSKMRQALE